MAITSGMRGGADAGRGDDPHYLPRLINAMARQANLSYSEAEGVIRARREGHNIGGEAVSHYGGVQKVLEDTFKYRHRWK